MMEIPSISLVIPLYNEKNLIEPAAEKCLRELKRQFSDYELILVDDGSTDGSAEVLSKIAQENWQVRIVRNDINLNVGASLQRGLCAARNDFVVHSGIDMPLPVEELRGFLLEMKDCDLLILERAGFSGYTLWRWICSRLNRLLLRVLFRHHFSDLNFSQIYRREIIRDILPVAKSPAFTTPEMILRAVRKGYRVKSLRCRYLPRPSGEGAFGKMHDILWSLYDMVRFAHGT